MSNYPNGAEYDPMAPYNQDNDDDMHDGMEYCHVCGEWIVPKMVYDEDYKHEVSTCPDCECHI